MLAFCKALDSIDFLSFSRCSLVLGGLAVDWLSWFLSLSLVLRSLRRADGFPELPPSSLLSRMLLLASLCLNPGSCPTNAEPISARNELEGRDELSDSSMGGVV